jgi:hypothetical protein
LSRDTIVASDAVRESLNFNALVMPLASMITPARLAAVSLLVCGLIAGCRSERAAAIRGQPPLGAPLSMAMPDSVRAVSSTMRELAVRDNGVRFVVAFRRMQVASAEYDGVPVWRVVELLRREQGGIALDTTLLRQSDLSALHRGGYEVGASGDTAKLSLDFAADSIRGSLIKGLDRRTFALPRTSRLVASAPQLAVLLAVARLDSGWSDSITMIGVGLRSGVPVMLQALGMDSARTMGGPISCRIVVATSALGRQRICVEPGRLPVRIVSEATGAHLEQEFIPDSLAPEVNPRFRRDSARGKPAS